MLHAASEMLIGTFLGGLAHARGDFAVVDEQMLLETLIVRCRDRGVILTEKCSLLNLSWIDNGRISVETTGETFLCQFVVDAAGGLSSISQTFHLHRLKGFYAVYGARLSNIQLHSPVIVLAYVGQLGHPPPVFEVIPCGPDSAYCAVFVYSHDLVAPSTLSAMFDSYCGHNPFFTMTPSTETVTPKLGSIPIGTLRRRRLPGIMPVGEAALVQPPLLGTAFNEILEYSDNVCSHVDGHLTGRGGWAKAAGYRYPLRKRIQDSLQLAVTTVLLRQNVEALDWLVRFADTLGPESVFGFCSNELTWMKLLEIPLRLPVYALVGARKSPLTASGSRPSRRA
jgi:hypothetical protein